MTKSLWMFTQMNSANVERTAHRIVRKELPAAWSWIIVPLEIEVEAFEIDGPWVK